MSDTKKLLHNLQFHAGIAAKPTEDHLLPRVASQFRPYKGTVDTALLAVVRDLARDFESASLGENAARAAGALAIWVMLNTVTSWVLDAGGMLQRNKLISKEDASLVREWVFEVEEIGYRLLDQDRPASKVTDESAGT